MTILEILQDAAVELGLRYPESIVGSSDRHARQLLAHAHEECEALLDEYLWPQLQREVTITLVNGQANYALPDDFDQHIFNTYWDSSNHWRLIGPATPQEWREIKSGITQLTPRIVFRLKGTENEQLFLHPTPGADDAGNTIVFEYISRSVARPKDWTALTTVAANTYIFLDGRIYSTLSGGLTGSVGPTHTTGAAVDGTVNWIYHDASYMRFLADTDTTVLPERLIKLGVKWRFRSARGFDFTQELKDYKRALVSAHSKLKSARDVSLGSERRGVILGDLRNVPDSGFGS